MLPLNTSAASTWPRPPAHTRRPPGIGAQEARSASARALGAAGRRQPPPQTARLAAPTNPTAVASDPASAARDPQAPATGAATARSFRRRATKRRLFRPRTATGSGRRHAGSVVPRDPSLRRAAPAGEPPRKAPTAAPARICRRKRKGPCRRPPHRPHGLLRGLLRRRRGGTTRRWGRRRGSLNRPSRPRSVGSCSLLSQVYDTFAYFATCWTKMV